MLKARKSKRWISVLVTLVFLLSLMPAAAFAGASSLKAVTSVEQFDPKASASATLETATVQVKLDPAIAGVTSSGIVEVVNANGSPLTITEVVYGDNAADACVAKIDSKAVGAAAGSIVINSKSFTFDMTPEAGAEKSTLNFAVKVDAKGAPEGDLTLRVFKTTGQLDPGEVVVATTGKGSVTVGIVGSVPNIGEGSGQKVNLRLDESIAGAIKGGGHDDKGNKVFNDVIKLKLPYGFTWDKKTLDGLDGTVKPAGTGLEVKAVRDSNDSRVLIIQAHGRSNNAAVIDISPTITVDADDARLGDVVASVDGASDTKVSPSELTIASYNDYGVSVKVDSVKELLAGKFNQKTDLITIKENIPGSFIEGRTVTITLPDEVKVTGVTDTDYSHLDNPVFDYNGKDNKVKIKITGTEDNKKGEIEFKLELSIEGDASGDIEAVISGAGIEETSLVIAKAVAPVSVSTEITDVKIGIQDQAVADIVITENKKAAIRQKSKSPTEDGVLQVWLDEGVKFAGTPDVEVTEGDLSIKAEGVKVKNGVLNIPVKSESMKPSTITISNVLVTLDRTIPEGPIYVKVGGNAVVENSETARGWLDGNPTGGDPEAIDEGEFRTDFAVKEQFAEVVTPAPGETKKVASFVIGSSTYVVDGVEYTMDAAPYVTAAGRTYVPVRYLAYALGVAAENVYWDQAAKTVTLLKGSTAVQLTIGSNIITVNGIGIAMDVAPEIVDGRTMLPARFVAEVFGATVGYDADTKTVTIDM